MTPIWKHLPQGPMCPPFVFGCFGLMQSWLWSPYHSNTLHQDGVLGLFLYIPAIVLGGKSGKNVIISNLKSLEKLANHQGFKNKSTNPLSGLHLTKNENKKQWKTKALWLPQTPWPLGPQKWLWNKLQWGFIKQRIVGRLTWVCECLKLNFFWRVGVFVHFS